MKTAISIPDDLFAEAEGLAERLGMSRSEMFARALRAFLRQDPDVIMLGEVRDQETADICLRAALTGHLVLSTLHTYTAMETLVRLRDLGVKPYVLASSLSGVISQKLVPRLCPGSTEPGRVGHVCVTAL